jgi:hypothetical protein
MTLKQVIASFEGKNGVKFTPTRGFYNSIGINQKRFGMLCNGALPMYQYEAEALTKYFGIQITDTWLKVKFTDQQKTATVSDTVAV